MQARLYNRNSSPTGRTAVNQYLFIPKITPPHVAMWRFRFGHARYATVFNQNLEGARYIADVLDYHNLMKPFE